MIKENLLKIKSTLPNHVTLVAVSKTKPKSAIEEAYEAGQRIFGENRAQELKEKAEALPKDIKWHMIGHLQRNKVKYIAPYVSLIHGVDSERLLEQIDKEAQKVNRKIPILIQVHIAEESSKFGFSTEEVKTFFQSLDSNQYPNVEIVGMMGMATFTDDQQQIIREFSSLKLVYDWVNENSGVNLTILSMGMSGDYKIAIDQGSSMVRIGSSIFGSRI